MMHPRARVCAQVRWRAITPVWSSTTSRRASWQNAGSSPWSRQTSSDTCRAWCSTACRIWTSARTATSRTVSWTPASACGTSSPTLWPFEIKPVTWRWPRCRRTPPCTCSFSLRPPPATAWCSSTAGTAATSSWWSWWKGLFLSHLKLLCVFIFQLISLLSSNNWCFIKAYCCEWLIVFCVDDAFHSFLFVLHVIRHGLMEVSNVCFVLTTVREQKVMFFIYFAGTFIMCSIWVTDRLSWRETPRNLSMTTSGIMWLCPATPITSTRWRSTLAPSLNTPTVHGTWTWRVKHHHHTVCTPALRRNSFYRWFLSWQKLKSYLMKNLRRAQNTCESHLKRRKHLLTTSSFDFLYSQQNFQKSHVCSVILICVKIKWL